MFGEKIHFIMMSFFLRLILVLLSCLLVFSGTSQEFSFDKRAVYIMTFQTDSSDVESRNTLNMELLINDDISLFQSLKLRQEDSILYYHDRDIANQFSFGGGIPWAPINKFNYKILKANGLMNVYDSAFGRNMEGKDLIYNYTEPIQMLDWQLKDDTLHFGDFICQRADVSFGGREWTAWFTTEIPISDGPYKFAGLPGLILKISDKKGYWDFELRDLETVSLDHAINFQKWFIIENKSKEELYKDRVTFQESLPAIAAGSQPSDPAIAREMEKQVQRLIKRLKADNNWIELMYN